MRFVASKTPAGVGKHIVNMVKGLCENPDHEVSALVAKDQLASGRVLHTKAAEPTGRQDFSHSKVI